MAGIELGSFISGTMGTMVGTIILVFVLLTFIGLLGAGVWYWKFRKVYDIEVRIYSKRFGSWKTWTDWGAIYKDKKTGQANGFKLKSEKEVMSPPPYGTLMMGVKGNVISMQQESTGHYYYLKPAFDDIDKLCADDKTLAVKLGIVPEDMRLWQSAQRQQIDILYTKTKWYAGLLAFLPYVICAVLILILIYMVLQKFEVLTTVSANLADAANALKDFKQSGALVPA